MRQTSEAAKNEQLERRRRLSDSDSASDSDAESAPIQEPPGSALLGDEAEAKIGKRAGAESKEPVRREDSEGTAEAEEEEEDDEVVWPKMDFSHTAVDAQECNVDLRLEPRMDGRYHFVSAAVNRWLRGYQRHGVQWMWKRIARGRGCILNDDMGLGKTGELIGLWKAN